jgi:hypothetical protein
MRATLFSFGHQYPAIMRDERNCNHPNYVWSDHGLILQKNTLPFLGCDQPFAGTIARRSGHKPMVI